MMKKILAVILILLFIPLFSFAEDLPSVIILTGKECLGCEEEGIVFEPEMPGTSVFLRFYGPVNFDRAVEKVQAELAATPKPFLSRLTCTGGEKGVRFLLVGGIHSAEKEEGRFRPDTYYSRVYLKDGYINIALAADVLQSETVMHALTNAWMLCREDQHGS